MEVNKQKDSGSLSAQLLPHQDCSIFLLLLLLFSIFQLTRLDLKAEAVTSNLECAVTGSHSSCTGLELQFSQKDDQHKAK